MDTQETKITPEAISACLESAKQVLLQKNKNYGNSMGEPINIFFKQEQSSEASDKAIRKRLDEKLSRVKNASELRKNDVFDVLGYITLLCVNRGWTDFSDQID